MSEQEIIEGNKLIAKFFTEEKLFNHSIILHGFSEDNDLFFDSQLKFHSSWNWLMPVVLKINTMDNFDYSVKIFTMDCQIENSKGEIIVRCECKYNPDELINSVWEAVVEFIKWYNSWKEKQ